VPRDYLVAAQEDLEGLTNLASMYLQGRGVGRDTAQASQLFANAAERGYAVAQNNLALMYANGEAVPSRSGQGVFPEYPNCRSYRTAASLSSSLR